MISLTQNAQKAISRFIRSNDSKVKGIRVSIGEGGCSGHQYEIQLVEDINEADRVMDCGGYKVFIEAQSEQLLDGLTVDYVDTLVESGFRFNNPNATDGCGCGKSFSV